MHLHNQLGPVDIRAVIAILASILMLVMVSLPDGCQPEDRAFVPATGPCTQ